MKKFSFSAIVVFSLLLFTNSLFASTSIIDTVSHDYGYSGYNPSPCDFYQVPRNSNYWIIKDNNFSDYFNYNISDNIIVTSFDVEIKFASTNEGSLSERWYITPGNMNKMGKYLLSNVSSSDFVTQVFTFTESELGALFEDLSNGSFLLAFTEDTWFSDYFYLDSAKLTVYGQAAPVPIPGAALLLGSAMLGLVGLRRARKV